MSLPYVFINAAMSADGKIASRDRRQFGLSGRLDFARVDELRSKSDAIMVGIETVLSDDPSLTVKSSHLRKMRHRDGMPENPARVVIDSRARTPPDADLFKRGEGERIIITTRKADKEKLTILKQQATIIIAGNEKVDLHKALGELKHRGYNTVMVEGGATLNWSLIRDGLVDEIYTFISNQIIGGFTSPTLVDGDGYSTSDETTRLTLISAESLDSGVLIKWRIAK